MKKIVLLVAKAGCCIISSALVGFILLSAVFLIPTDRMNEHLFSSAEVIAREGTFPYSDITGELDNFTDSTILLNAAHKNTGSFIENVLLVKRYSVPEKNPAESLVAIYKNGETNYISANYQRYWHGYLLVVKPLLYFMDYSSIRVLDAVVGTSVIAFTIFLFIKKRLHNLVIPYVLSILLLKPVGIFSSLQYSSCFYIMSASIIAILLIKDTKKYAFYVFLFSGIATAFFDFLTYPMATFGVAAAIYFIITYDTLKGKILNLIKIFSLWFVGYVGMWVSKWALTSLLVEGDILTEVIERLVLRSSLSADGGERFNLWNAIYRNIKQIINKPMALLIFVFVLVSVIYIIVSYKRSARLTKNQMRNIVLFITLTALPFVWYTFTINHSVIHSFFTNKSLVVSAFSGMCIFLPIMEKPQLD